MAPQDTQTAAFLQGEGDAWFGRNRGALTGKESYFECDLITGELAPFHEGISDLLEIGCGDGHKAELLARFFGARAAGIDPSQEAIAHGLQRLEGRIDAPAVDLRVATADRLPFADASFDLVYFGFCLYLVGRSQLLSAVAEADRVLRSGGFLAILDFDPPQRMRRAYHHRPGLYSYKQDYASMFTATGAYQLFGKRSFSHSGQHFSRDPQERVAMSFLYKDPDPYLPAAPQGSGT